MLTIWFFVGKWWTRQRRCITIGFLDLDIFTSAIISQHSSLVVKAIANTLNNDYVVGAYYTGHWVTLIICIKFKEIWYLDSSKQYLARKFTDLKSVVDWSVSCRSCSQKYNLLVFLFGIADHVGPLVHMHRTKWRKERKKAKSHNT
jgi:hypothetical protein